MQFPESKKTSVNYDTECLITMHGNCTIGLVVITIYAKFHQIRIIDAISVRLLESAEHLIPMQNFIKIYNTNRISVISLITTMQPSFGRKFTEQIAIK